MVILPGTILHAKKATDYAPGVIRGSKLTFVTHSQLVDRLVSQKASSPEDIIRSVAFETL